MPYVGYYGIIIGESFEIDLTCAYLKQVSKDSQDTFCTYEIKRSRLLFCYVSAACTATFSDNDGWCVDLSMVYVVSQREICTNLSMP